MDESIGEYLKEQQERATCFSPFHTPEFVTPELDFQIDTDNFLAFLKAEKKDTQYKEGESYANNVGSMCEYSCLYVAMILHEKELKGDLKIICGNYGWWEHYWLSYKLDGVEYFLDLTLQQFVEDAPKFSISIAKQHPHGYNYDEEWSCETIEEYVDRQRAFQFYVNPKDL